MSELRKEIRELARHYGYNFGYDNSNDNKIGCFVKIGEGGPGEGALGCSPCYVNEDDVNTLEELFKRGAIMINLVKPN